MKLSAILAGIILSVNPLLATTVQTDTLPKVDYTDSFLCKSREFGLNLFKSIAITYEDQNFIFSPFDAQISISMMGNLFNRNSVSNLTKLFGCENLSELNSRNEHIITQLTYGSDFGDPTIISNSIWFNVGFRHNKTDAIRRHYNAMVQHKNLSDTSRKSSINSWIKKSISDTTFTPNITLPVNTAISINSLLYYNQQWEWDYHFSGTFYDTFFTPGGERKTAYMTDEIEANHFNNEAMESVILKLKKYHLICILPNSQSLSTLTKNFDADVINKIYKESSTRGINLTFPKFNLNSDINLLPIIKQYGINPAKDLATNTRILSEFIHLNQASSIRVDQIGVASGSFTIMQVIVGENKIEEPIELKFNRPFIFFVIDPETAALLTAGQYVGPE